MATTTNYSWTTPDDTDLVKDGAAAIRTLGSSADTTVKNLNPGTTAGDIDYYTSATAKARIAIGTANQVLQVNSGATAPEWGVDPVADVITTAGDLIYGTAADTVARLGIGTAGQVLTVNSGATAPEWGTIATGTTAAGCYLQKSAAQTISNTTFTSLTWDTETIDTDAFHSTVTNTDRITIPAGKGGKYLVHCMIIFAFNATNTRQLEIKKNGTTVSNNIGGASHSNNAPVFCTTILDLVAGDYITAEAWQNSGGNLNVQGNNLAIDNSRFTAFYLGA